MNCSAEETEEREIKCVLLIRFVELGIPLVFDLFIFSNYFIENLILQQTVNCFDPSDLYRPENVSFAEKDLSKFRDYTVHDNDPKTERVLRTYKQMHTNQTVDFVRGKFADSAQTNKNDDNVSSAIVKNSNRSPLIINTFSFSSLRSRFKIEFLSFFFFCFDFSKILRNRFSLLLLANGQLMYS